MAGYSIDMRSIIVTKRNLKWLCLFLAFVIVSLPDHIAVADDGTAGHDSYEISICQTNLTNILPPPYNKMSNLVCKRVWNNYVIRYSLTKDNVLTVILSTLYTTGWVGIGFSKDGLMLGSSAMVGWINSHGVPRIKQYYIQGMTAEKIIPNKGELQLTSVPETAVFHEASIYLAFQIKLENPHAKQNILLAYGAKYPNLNFRLSRHDDQSSLKMYFSSDSGVEEYQEQPWDTIRTHGLLGILGWGLFLPIGTIIARYFRHKDPLWFYLHTVIQLSGYLLILANFFTGLRSYYINDSNDSTLESHKALGMFAVSLANLQILALFIRPVKESKFRKYWNWCHHWTGRAGLFCGMVNIMMGIQIGDQRNELKIGYGFLLCFTLVAVSILEILAYFARREAEDKAKAMESPTPI